MLVPCDSTGLDYYGVSIRLKDPHGQTRLNEGKLMKMNSIMIVAASLVALAGCSKESPADNLASEVQANADNSADNVTAAADNEAGDVMNDAKSKATAIKNDAANEAADIRNEADNKAAALKNSSSNAADNSSSKKSK